MTSIRSELTRLRDTGVTDEELAGVQRYLIGSMALQLETNAGITSLMQQIEQFDLGLDYVERRPALVQAVTRDAILDAVRHHLPAGHHRHRHRHRHRRPHPALVVSGNLPPTVVSVILPLMSDVRYNVRHNI